MSEFKIKKEYVSEMRTVGGLINQLKEYPEDTRVFITTTGNYNDGVAINAVAGLNGEKKDGADDVLAVVIIGGLK